MNIMKNPQIFVEKQENIAGSTAGAGSGEFHHYRIQRRRERARLYHIEKEAKIKEIQDNFESFKAQRQEEVMQKIAKKADRRRKKKEHLKNLRKKKKIEKLATSMNKFENDGSFLERFLANKQGETVAERVEKKEEIGEK